MNFPATNVENTCQVTVSANDALLIAARTCSRGRNTLPLNQTITLEMNTPHRAKPRSVSRSASRSLESTGWARALGAETSEGAGGMPGKGVGNVSPPARIPNERVPVPPPLHPGSEPLLYPVSTMVRTAVSEASSAAPVPLSQATEIAARNRS